MARVHLQFLYVQARTTFLSNGYVIYLIYMLLVSAECVVCTANLNGTLLQHHYQDCKREKNA